jgi:hypothetical protein
VAEAVASGQLVITAPTGPSWAKLKLWPGAVGLARGFAADVLGEAGIHSGDHVDAVVLVVSELITNGMRAAATLRTADGRPVRWTPYDTPVHLGVAVRPRWTHVYAVDPDPALPPPVSLDDPLDEDGLLSERGRGLSIVAANSILRWSVQGQYGKTIHVIVPLEPGLALTAEEQDALHRRTIV